jgi:hypothetical protein
VSLRRCVEAAGVGEEMLDVTFDVSPEGAVENVALLRWKDGTAVTGLAQACVASVLRLIRYPASEDAPCKVRRRIGTYLDP